MKFVVTLLDNGTDAKIVLKEKGSSQMQDEMIKFNISFSRLDAKRYASSNTQTEYNC